MNRRSFIGKSALTTAGIACRTFVGETSPEPIIDIHQHVGYSGRSNEQLLAHQEAMGATLTILLPSGKSVSRRSTHGGRSNGLGAGVAGNEATRKFAEARPKRYRFFANEVADLPSAIRTIRAYLERGALGIGEQKFGVRADSKYIEALANLARECNVPMLLHFQYGMYNNGLDGFHKVLEKFPDVNFIGHAQTWWGSIDQNHRQEVMFPQGNVTPGGLTDRLLSDYPNLFGDLSSRYGLNALIRDEAHTRAFLDRHQDQLLFGSDCNDAAGEGADCVGARIIAAVRRLAPNKSIERKILFENAVELLQLEREELIKLSR